MQAFAPHNDLRVLDLSRIPERPSCMQLPGDLAAKVIKVEKPGVDDGTRMWGPPVSYRRAPPKRGTDIETILK